MADRYYIGARYIPAVYEAPDGSNTWLPGVAYDGLVIVTYGNYSYMSKKPVPAGVGSPDVNMEYWIKAAVYNADVNNVVEQLENVVEQLENKADKDGVYPDLFAGNLISETMQKDNAPYLERETAGGLSGIAPLCYPTLVGASVAENQFCSFISGTVTTNGLTIVKDAQNGTVTINGTATGRTLVEVANFPSIINHVIFLSGCPSGGNGSTYMITEGYANFYDIGNGKIGKIGRNITIIQIVISNDTVCDNLVFRPQLTDITTKFGSSIADYVYTLEQATAGSGIAWLQSYGFLTDDYVPYNAGTIESVEATTKVVRDENGENAVTYPLGNDVLRGIFKLDANNQLYADGDVKTSDGTVTRKYGVVDLGTVNWAYSSTSQYFETRSVLNRKAGSLNLITAKYVTGTRTGQGNITDKMITSGTNDDNIVIRDLDYTDATTFKNALSGVYLVYELATPTTEQGDPFPSPQVCYPDGTEEFVTENGVPVGHETEYPYDLKGILEKLAEVPAANGTYTLKATRSGADITYTWDQEV